LAGATGGVAVYFITKAGAYIANINIRKQELNSGTKRVMRHHFPKSDLEAVCIKEGSTIPPN